MPIRLKYLLASAALLVSLNVILVSTVLFQNSPELPLAINSISPRTQVAALEGAGSGLVGWWKFDEGSGTTAGDSSGNGNTGTIVNGAGWTAGQLGGGISVNGIGSAINAGSATSLDNIQDQGGGGMSVAFWLKTSSSTNVQKDIIAKGGGNSNGGTWDIRKGPNSPYRLQFTKEGVVDSQKYYNNILELGVWQHFVITWNGSMAFSTGVLFYKNGSLFIGTPNVTDGNTPNSDASSPLCIGNLSAIGSSACSNALTTSPDMILDDVRIYNRVLLAAEIAELYAYDESGNEPFPPPAPINGACSISNNSCTVGTLSDISDTGTEYLWSCTGSNGGTTASCSQPILPDSTPPITISPPLSGVNQVDLLNSSGAVINTFTTIQACATAAVAGQTCKAYAGTYDERVLISNKSGTSEAWINFLADGQVIVRGMDISNSNYIRIAGYEFAMSAPNTSLAYRVFQLLGTSSHIDIIDNYFHDAGQAIRQATNGSHTSYITVRGNRFYHLGYISGLVSNSLISTAVSSGAPEWGSSANHWLVEYNEFERVADGIVVGGQYNIFRNNYYHDFADSYWATAPNTQHSDFFQTGSDHANMDTKHQVVEANFGENAIEANSHFGIWQDQINSSGGPYGDTDVLIRGNVAANFGSGAVGDIQTPNLSVYGNTFQRINSKSAGSAIAFYKRTTQLASNLPQNCLVANNIFSNSNLGVNSGYTSAIYIQPGSGVTKSNNLGFSSGIDTSYISTDDPRFVNSSAYDFTLQSGSLAIDAGMNTAHITSTSGNGTTFDVSNGMLFNDGWGMTAGDMIKVGNNNPVRIVSINGNNITVNTPISWNNGDRVNWRNQDGSPDIGAYEYRPSGYGVTNSLSYRGGLLTATVNDPSIVRFVEFWIDGTHVSVDYDYPYVLDTSAYAIGSVHVAKAVARPLFASRTLAYEDSRTITIGTDSGATLPSSTCTSFSYSSWGSCTNGTQTRAVLSLSPSGCTGGTPITSQSCTTSPSSDTTPPTITIAAPLNNSAISGSVTLTAQASDPSITGQTTSGISTVQFKLDGLNLGSPLTTSPYTGTWNTQGVTNGTHILTAVATDGAGNTKTSAGITINVQNTAPVVVAPTPAINAPNNPAVPNDPNTPNTPVTPNTPNTPNTSLNQNPTPTPISPTGIFTPLMPQRPLGTVTVKTTQTKPASNPYLPKTATRSTSSKPTSTTAPEILPSPTPEVLINTEVKILTWYEWVWNLFKSIFAAVANGVKSTFMFIINH